MKSSTVYTINLFFLFPNALSLRSLGEESFCRGGTHGMVFLVIWMGAWTLRLGLGYLEIDSPFSLTRVEEIVYHGLIWSYMITLFLMAPCLGDLVMDYTWHMIGGCVYLIILDLFHLLPSTSLIWHLSHVWRSLLVDVFHFPCFCGPTHTFLGAWSLALALEDSLCGPFTTSHALGA